MQSLSVGFLSTAATENSGKKNSVLPSAGKPDKSGGENSFKSLLASYSRKDAGRSVQEEPVSGGAGGPGEKKSDKIPKNAPQDNVQDAERVDERTAVSSERVSSEKEERPAGQDTDAVSGPYIFQMPQEISRRPVISGGIRDSLKEIINDMKGVSAVISDEAQVSITPAQFMYLKSGGAGDENFLDSLIDNAEEYVLSVTESGLLVSAQDLSVEDPEAFLGMASMGGMQLEDESPLSRNDIKEDAGEFLSGAELTRRSPQRRSRPEELGALTVIDERTSVRDAAALIFSDSDDFKIDDAGLIRTDGHDSLNVTVSLSQQASQNILSLDDQSAGAAGSTFQQMLTQQIQEHAPDFVRAGSIVLRDNDQGSINMNLRPESLGNVKINLHVSDKVITGEITVASKEAYEAFRQNLDTLKQAFQQSGFENAALNLNLAQNSGSGFMHQEQQRSSEDFVANRTLGSYAGSASDEAAGDVSTVASYYGLDNLQVDMIA